jgi:hypothetical protein
MAKTEQDLKETNKTQVDQEENKTTPDQDMPRNQFVKDEDIVQVPRAEWEQMKKDVTNIKKGVSDEGIKAIAPQEHRVRMRFYKGKPVVKVGKVFVEKDEKERDVEYIPVWVEGAKQAVAVLYSDFYFKFDRKEVKVLKRVQEEKREHQHEAYTDKKEVQGYRTVNTGLKVPVVVVSQQETFVVELSDGNVVELDQSAVN